VQRQHGVEIAGVDNRALLQHTHRRTKYAMTEITSFLIDSAVRRKEVVQFDFVRRINVVSRPHA